MWARSRPHRPQATSGVGGQWPCHSSPLSSPSPIRTSIRDHGPSVSEHLLSRVAAMQLASDQRAASRFSGTDLHGSLLRLSPAPTGPVAPREPNPQAPAALLLLPLQLARPCCAPTLHVEVIKC